jgi:hypothetical protein
VRIIVAAAIAVEVVLQNFFISVPCNRHFFFLFFLQYIYISNIVFFLLFFPSNVPASLLRDLSQSLSGVLRSDTADFRTRSVVGWMHGVLCTVPHYRVVRSTASSSTTASTTGGALESANKGATTLLEQCVSLVCSFELIFISCILFF